MKNKIYEIVDTQELGLVIILRETRDGKLYLPTKSSQDRLGRLVVKRFNDKTLTCWTNLRLPGVYRYKLTT